MRIVSISVNGLTQAIEKGFFKWLADQDADVVCVQDHRMRAYEIEERDLIPKGYQAYFIDGELDSHGGVGIYSRSVPKAIIYGYGDPLADREGRFIQADFHRVSVASVLAPDAMGREGEVYDEAESEASFLDHKRAFLASFGNHLQKTLRKRRQFIFCGNLQIAHHVTDASPRFHEVDVSVFLPEERAWLDSIIDDQGWIDVFRDVNRSGDQFSWWPEWAKGWRRHAGLRTDYHLLTPGIRKSIQSGWIDGGTRFSDHAPVIMDYDLGAG